MRLISPFFARCPYLLSLSSANRLGVLGRDPLVRADLELRRLDRVVLGRQPRDVPELDLALRRVAVVRRPELGAQHPVLRVPVDARVEPHDVAARLEDHALLDRDLRRAVLLVPHDRRPVDDGSRRRARERARRRLEVLLADVPGVERELVRVLGAARGGSARRPRARRRSASRHETISPGGPNRRVRMPLQIVSAVVRELGELGRRLERRGRVRRRRRPGTSRRRP